MIGGTRAEVCQICGRAFLAGCVMGEPCPECEAARMTLEHFGWKRISDGYGARFGLGEELWIDPRFPESKKTRSEAMKIQEGRDRERRKS